MVIKTTAVKSATKRKPAAKPKGGARPKSKAKAKAKPEETEAKKSGPDPKLKLADVLAALRATGGIKAAAAVQLKVGRRTLHRFLAENQDAMEGVSEIDEEIKDLAEGKILQAIRAGDMQTVRWFMELKGKDRGYVRRVENVGKDGGPIETAQKMDLSQLSDEELAIMKRAAEKREREAGGK